MAEPSTPLTSADYLKQISEATAGKTGLDAANAITNLGESIYSANSNISGHSDHAFTLFSQALTTYIKQGTDAGFAGSGQAVPAMAAQQALQGYKGGHWWGQPSVSQDALDQVGAGFSTQFDHRSRADIIKNIDQSFGISGFDAAKVSAANAALNSPDLSLDDLKTFDRSTVQLRSVPPATTANVDATAAQYATIIRDGYPPGQSKGSPVNNFLTTLGGQGVSSADPAREALVKGLQASSYRGSGYDVTAAVQHVTQKGYINYNDSLPVAGVANQNPQTATTPGGTVSDPHGGGAGGGTVTDPHAATTPAAGTGATPKITVQADPGAPQAPVAGATAVDNGAVHYQTGQQNLQGADLANETKYIDAQLAKFGNSRGNAPGRGNLRVVISASVDANATNQGVNQAVLDGREHNLETLVDQRVTAYNQAHQGHEIDLTVTEKKSGVQTGGKADLSRRFGSIGFQF